MARETVLIIKHGFSETCDHSVSPIVSYGDVFRCTCLLEDFKGKRVTWITARSAAELLGGNHLIDELYLADRPEDLPGGRIQPYYDTVINLEKQRDWCQFAAALDAKTRFGFRDWTKSGRECFYPASGAPLSEALERDEFRPFQETLFRTIGREWRGQRYVLGYRPRVVELYDIGLNNHVGPKWPTKTWPRHFWEQLYDQLSDRYLVCWQQSLNSIRHYVDWLASCRLIVTCDSLGLHLGLGLKKKLVALFGPTSAEQVYMYGHGIKLTPVCDARCVPCFQPRCVQGQSCMESISVEMVAETVEMLLESRPQRSRESVRGPSELALPVSVTS